MEHLRVTESGRKVAMNILIRDGYPIDNDSSTDYIYNSCKKWLDHSREMGKQRNKEQETEAVLIAYWMFEIADFRSKAN